jgi:hypothetical protein
MKTHALDTAEISIPKDTVTKRGDSRAIFVAASMLSVAMLTSAAILSRSLASHTNRYSYPSNQTIFDGHTGELWGFAIDGKHVVVPDGRWVRLTPPIQSAFSQDGPPK